MSIVIDQVTKSFGDVVAVSDVSATVGPGVTALLGPNGAGKSTLFRIMCGLTLPTSGSVTVLGADVRRKSEVRGRIGLVPQQDALFDHLDATELVRLSARLHRVDNPDAAVSWALEQVDLTDTGSKPVGNFSKGMRQRVKIAAGIVNNPDVIILDEPLNGLDPVQRRNLTALFHSLAADGRTVVVSSHVLEEVARLGSRVLVIAQGRLAAAGDFRDLRALMDDRPQQLRVGTDQPQLLAAELVRLGIAAGVSVGDGAIVVQTDAVDRLRVELAPLARQLNVHLRELVPLDDDLESVFRYVVGAR